MVSIPLCFTYQSHMLSHSKSYTYAPCYHFELYQILWPMQDALYLLFWSSTCAQATSITEVRYHTPHIKLQNYWLTISLHSIKKKREREKMACQRSMAQKEKERKDGMPKKHDPKKSNCNIIIKERENQ